MIWLNIGLSRKITKIRTTPLFYEAELSLATSMESSRRDLLNDMAEHRPILKNNRNTHQVSHPKPIYSIPQNGVFVFTVYRNHLGVSVRLKHRGIRARYVRA